MKIPALWQQADFAAQMLRLEHGADHLGVLPLEGRVEMHHLRQLVTSPPTQAHVPQGLHWQPCPTHTAFRTCPHTRQTAMSELDRQS